MAKAPLIEIFHSIQGEGRFVGMPMVFLRVATCPLRCLYCDTPYSYTAGATFAVRAGQHARQEPNPCTGERAADLVREVLRAAPLGGPRTVSVTGGEPLVVPAFVADLAARLRGDQWRVHLETAAVDAGAFSGCAAGIDHLSADWKLPETLPDGADHGSQHLGCIERAVQSGITVDVKMVLTPQVSEESFARALSLLAPLQAGILLVLQPVTPFGAVVQGIDAAFLERCAGLAARAHFDLRVLPQVHKTLGVP
jgi:organic radical activating enzyme